MSVRPSEVVSPQDEAGTHVHGGGHPAAIARPIYNKFFHLWTTLWKSVGRLYLTRIGRCF